MREYARILRGPAGSLLLVSGIARLAFGVAGLAFLVFVEEQTDSFATSGLAVGLFGATSALFAPLRGRFVDRYGAPALLAFTVGYAASNLSIPG
nr:MFS transporter [Solirubrobacterales bacterium]